MWTRRAKSDLAAALADAFLAGDWNRSELLERGSRVFERRPRWLPRVVGGLLQTYRDRPADRPRELAAFLERTIDELDGQNGLTLQPPAIRNRVFAEPAMGRMRWPVPEIASLGELAAFLDVHLGELKWLADPRQLERKAVDERLRNYRYVWRPRRGSPHRLIEQPKRLLKDLQRRVLHDIVDGIPPHETAHGFRRGHSALTHARQHVGHEVVLRFDLEDFFASVDPARVYAIFRTAGYPESVAYHLTALATNVIPHGVWANAQKPEEPRLLAAHFRLGRRLAAPHLPQGAPTSPALANLATLAFDRRLSGLAESVGAVYSRYADDFALSGGTWLIGHAAQIREAIAAIAREEGFRVNKRKSQLTTRAGRQILTGIVVNERPNLARRDYDRLKATLHNAARRGPTLENRLGVPDFRSHLLGRIAWVESLNPRRGAKLHESFAHIRWD